MSISQVRSIIEKPGCSITLAVVMVGGITAGLVLNSSCSKNPQATQISEAQIVGHVGETPITMDQFSLVFENTRSRAEDSFAFDPVGSEYQTMIQALQQSIAQSAAIELGSRYGVQPTDTELLNLANQQVEQGLQMMRTQMISQGLIQEDATEQDFADAFKKATGRDLAEVRKMQEDEIKKNIEDPNKRIALAAQVVQPAIVATKAQSLNPTDEEVKRSFDEAVVKQIFLSEASAEEPLQEKAQKIYNEIQDGTITFEKAIDRYSNAIPRGDTPLSESTSTMRFLTIQANDAYAPLRTLEPGGITPPIKEPQGMSIYKLIKINENAPEDFEERKDALRKAYVGNVANVQVNTELADMVENNVTWESKGFEALYELFKVPAASSGVDTNAKLQKVGELASEALQTDYGYGRRAGLLVNFVIAGQGYQSASDEEKPAARDKFIEATSMVLSEIPGTQTYLQLASLLEEAGNKEGVYDNVLQAAQSNQRADQIGEILNNVLKATYEDYKTKDIFTDEQQQKIEAEFDRWQKDRQFYLDQQAEQQKLEEEARAQAEEERRQYEEEQRKQQEEAENTSEDTAPEGQ